MDNYTLQLTNSQYSILKYEAKNDQDFHPQTSRRTHPYFINFHSTFHLNCKPLAFIPEWNNVHHTAAILLSPSTFYDATSIGRSGQLFEHHQRFLPVLPLAKDNGAPRWYRERVFARKNWICGPRVRTPDALGAGFPFDRRYW